MECVVEDAEDPCSRLTAPDYTDDSVKVPSGEGEVALVPVAGYHVVICGVVFKSVDGYQCHR